MGKYLFTLHVFIDLTLKGDQRSVVHECLQFYVILTLSRLYCCMEIHNKTLQFRLAADEVFFQLNCMDFRLTPPSPPPSPSS